MLTKKLAASAIFLCGIFLFSVLLAWGTHLVAYDDVPKELAATLEGENVYRAASRAEESGYVIYVRAEVEIEDGEMKAVELTEYDNKGLAKDEDYYYDKWHEAMEKMPERFVEAGSTDVEVVSGATVTSEKAIEAVENALKLNEGITGPFDGTYMGTSTIDHDEGWGVALVTFQDGEMKEVVLKEVDRSGEFKDEDYGFDLFHEAQEEMADRFVEADSHDVDIFTGATASSNKWIQAVKSALQNAGGG